MKIFVSHSFKDKKPLVNICRNLGGYGFKFGFAEHNIDIKNTISQKIERMIHACSVGIVFLTRSGLNSGFVREEMGYFKRSKRPLILVIEKGLSKKYGGLYYGYDHIEYDPKNPEYAQNKIRDTLLRYHKKQSDNNMIWLGIGIFVSILLLGSGK